MKTRKMLRKEIEHWLYQLLRLHPHDGRQGDNVFWNAIQQLEHMRVRGDKDFCFDLRTAFGISPWLFNVKVAEHHQDHWIMAKLKNLEDELKELDSQTI